MASKPEPAVFDAKPHWPYAKVNGKQLDKDVHLPAPIVEDGVWYLSSDDIQCLSIGCGILGSGGGGDPVIFKQLAIKEWLRGKTMKIYHPKRFQKYDENKTMFCVAGLMGDPTAVHSADQFGVNATVHALQLVQKALASGVCDPHNGDGTSGNSKVRVIKETMADGSVVCLANVDDLKKVDIGSDVKIPEECRIAGIITPETGPGNTVASITCATEAACNKDEVRLIDFGCEGRALPKLSMWLPFLHGIKPYPSVISDVTGNNLACCTHIDKTGELEDFFRAKAVNMGSMAGFSFGVMSLKDVLNMCVPFTISHAWEIGRRVIRASRKNENPMKAVLKEENGSLTIISGKITEVKLPKKGKSTGFNSKCITVTGSDDYTGHIVTARALNEIYAVLSNDVSKKRMYACSPDIISMVDPITGFPITASCKDLEGTIVSLICLPSDPKLKAPKVIDALGPKAYPDLVDAGYTDYVSPSSVTSSSAK